MLFIHIVIRKHKIRGDYMTTYILYTLAAIMCFISYLNNKDKTKRALIKACKSIENIMPQFLSIIVIVGLMLAFIDTNTVSKFIGSESGFIGVFFLPF